MKKYLNLLDFYFLQSIFKNLYLISCLQCSSTTLFPGLFNTLRIFNLKIKKEKEKKGLIINNN